MTLIFSAITGKNIYQVTDTKLTKNWIKIPNSKKKGIGIWIPLKFHQDLPKNFVLRDSYVVRKNNKYYLHFCVEITEPKKYVPKNVHAVDLGLKNPVTRVS